MAVKINAFAASDYVVFFATILFSMGIGVYFAMQGRKKKTEGEYLMGSRGMSVFPVSVSITVSFLSAIAILGNPAEMYNQGASFMLIALGVAGGCLIATFVFVPLFYPLQLTSTFEYLERRYKSRKVRLLGTCLQITAQIIYMGTASFAPSTALKIVTGFPVWATLMIMAAVSTFYTSIGGMKAVIWTDVFQCLIMISGILAIIIQGSLKVGGFSKVFEINEDWGRLNVWNFDPSPTIRHSFWSLCIGGTFHWMGMFGLSQPSVQRYCSLPTLKKAQLTASLLMFAANFLIMSCCLCGLVIFAYYVIMDCDPIGKKLVDNTNQLVPFFVMETLSYPCVPGIFISALFSGALSSVSSSLNALAAITWEDILKPALSKSMTATRKLLILKGTVCVYGCLALGVSLIVMNLEGTILQITISFMGAVNGPNNGMFILGAFFPWATAKGAIGGAILSFAFSFWVAVGAFVTGIPKDKYDFPNGTCSAYFTNSSTMSTMSPLTTSAFPYTTTAIPHEDSHPGIEKLYTISYLWYSTIGMMSTVIWGLIISFITGPNKTNDIPTEYQIPLASRVYCCLPKSWQNRLNCNRDFEDPEDVCKRLAVKDDDMKEMSATSIVTNKSANFDNPGYTDPDGPTLVKVNTKTE